MPFADVNGVRINYREHGSGFPLVLNHGGYSDLSVWDDHVAALSARYRVIVWDRRNCGESGASDEDTYDYWVEDLRQLLGHLGIDRAYVGGSSLGALLSLEFTLAHPEMVEAAMCIAGTTAGFEPTERLVAHFPNRQGQVGHVTTPVLILNGANDEGATFVPANAQKAAEELPNSELVILYGIGHSVSREAPDVFKSVVLGYLAKQDARRGAPQAVSV